MQASPHPAKLLSGQICEVASFEDDSATGRARQLHNGASNRGFPAARLTDQSERLSPTHCEAHPCDGHKLPPSGKSVFDRHTFDGKQRGIGHAKTSRFAPTGCQHA